MPEQSEPTTGELIEALRCDGVIKPCEGCFFAFQIENCAAMGCRTDDMFGLAADRLESQARELSGIAGELEKLKAFHERYAEQTSKQYVVAVCGLTARAEQAEKERDEVEKSLARRIMQHLSDYEFDSTFVCEICEYNLTNSPKCLSCGSDHHHGKNFELKHILSGLPQEGVNE